MILLERLGVAHLGNRIVEKNPFPLRTSRTTDKSSSYNTKITVTSWHIQDNFLSSLLHPVERWLREQGIQPTRHEYVLVEGTARVELRTDRFSK